MPLPSSPVDAVLSVAVVVAAAFALLSRARLAAVVSFVLCGGLLALTWAVLSAPDLTLAEVALGTGVTSALLVSGIAGPRAAGEVSAGRPSWLLVVPAALLSVGLAGGVGTALLTASRDPGGPLLTSRVAEAQADTASSHPITAVLLDFRAWDTFLEVVVVLTAVLVAYAVAGPLGRPGTGTSGTPGRGASSGGASGGGASGGGQGDARSADPADTPLAIAGFDDFLRLAVPFVFLLALWVLFAGAAEPGGAFQAAAVLTGLVVLACAAGWRAGPLRGAAGRVAIAVGPGVFLASAGLGLLTAGHWFALPAGLETAATIGVEVALALSLGAGLATLVLTVAPLPARSGARR